MELVYSVPENYEEIVDTANRIFTMQSDGSYDNRYFQDLQPKLYRSPEQLPPHLLAYENGKLVGMVCLKQNLLRIGQGVLNVYGIGTVGVLQEYRGRGLMQAMMNRANNDLRIAGADLAELGGRRKRYSHFGYTTGGVGLNLTLAPEEFDLLPECPLRFEECTQLSCDEQMLICRLRKAEGVYIERKPEQFATVLQTGRHLALKIMDGQTCIGVCSVNCSHDTLYELTADPAYDVMQIMGAYCRQFELRSLNLYHVSLLWAAKHPAVLHAASAIDLREQERYRIFDYCRVVKAGISVKAEQQELMPGKLTLAIQNYGNLTIQVGDGILVQTNCSSVPDLELSEEEAVQLLMGCSAYLGGLNHRIPAFAAGWFPLPIHIDSNDRV